MSKKTQRARVCTICGKNIRTMNDNLNHKVLLCSPTCMEMYWCALHIKYATKPVKHLQAKKDKLAKFNIIIR